jgi:hypothetical protein
LHPIYLFIFIGILPFAPSCLPFPLRFFSFFFTMDAPPPPVVTFHQLYTDAASDQHNGNYATLMATFADALQVDHDDLHRIATGNGIGIGNSYIAMAEHPTDLAGRSFVYHGIVMHPTVIGLPTLWDGSTYAFVNDVVDGDIFSVPFTSGLFQRSRANIYTNLPATVERCSELWAANPDALLLDPLPDGDAAIRQVRTRRIMQVPPRYLPILLGRHLTPRQLWLELVGAIVANHDAVPCAPLVDWVMMACFRRAPNEASSLTRAAPSVPPLANADFIRHRRSILHHLLPALATTPAAHLANPAGNAQLVNIVGLLLDEQRLAREDDRARHAAAKAPKLPSAFWSPADADFLCRMCEVNHEDQLPELWLALAAGGKGDCTILARLLAETATAEGCPGGAPIASCHLSKKFSDLQFAGHNVDDLSEGIQPFALVVRDLAITTEQVQALAALDRANTDYDQLMRGTATSGLADQQTLRGNPNVKIAQSFQEAKSLLIATRILLRCMLGSEHSLYCAFRTFVSTLANQENLYQRRLRHVPHGPAVLLRYVQLALINWFRELSETALVTPATPLFDQPLKMLFHDNLSWCPRLPDEYLIAPTVPPVRRGPPAPAPPHPPGPAPPAAAADKPARRTNEAVLNPNVSACFAAFQPQLDVQKVAELVKVHKAPPILRSGASMDSCLSYHLRGRCWSTCARRADHAPRTPTQDQDLVTWATTALT